MARQPSSFRGRAMRHRHKSCCVWSFSLGSTILTGAVLVVAGVRLQVGPSFSSFCRDTRTEVDDSLFDDLERGVGDVPAASRAAGSSTTPSPDGTSTSRTESAVTVPVVSGSTSTPTPTASATYININSSTTLPPISVSRTVLPLPVPPARRGRGLSAASSTARQNHLSLSHANTYAAALGRQYSPDAPPSTPASTSRSREANAGVVERGSTVDAAGPSTFRREGVGNEDENEDSRGGRPGNEVGEEDTIFPMSMSSLRQEEERGDFPRELSPCAVESGDDHQTHDSGALYFLPCSTPNTHRVQTFSTTDSFQADTRSTSHSINDNSRSRSKTSAAAAAPSASSTSSVCASPALGAAPAQESFPRRIAASSLRLRTTAASSSSANSDYFAHGRATSASSDFTHGRETSASSDFQQCDRWSCKASASTAATSNAARASFFQSEEPKDEALFNNIKCKMKKVADAPANTVPIKPPPPLPRLAVVESCLLCLAEDTEDGFRVGPYGCGHKFCRTCLAKSPSVFLADKCMRRCPKCRRPPKVVEDMLERTTEVTKKKRFPPGSARTTAARTSSGRSGATRADGSRRTRRRARAGGRGRVAEGPPPPGQVAEEVEVHVGEGDQAPPTRERRGRPLRYAAGLGVAQRQQLKKCLVKLKRPSDIPKGCAREFLDQFLEVESVGFLPRVSSGGQQADPDGGLSNHGGLSKYQWALLAAFALPQEDQHGRRGSTWSTSSGAGAVVWSSQGASTALSGSADLMLQVQERSGPEDQQLFSSVVPQPSQPQPAQPQPLRYQRSDTPADGPSRSVRERTPRSRRGRARGRRPRVVTSSRVEDSCTNDDDCALSPRPPRSTSFLLPDHKLSQLPMIDKLTLDFAGLQICSRGSFKDATLTPEQRRSLLLSSSSSSLRNGRGTGVSEELPQPDRDYEVKGTVIPIATTRVGLLAPGAVGVGSATIDTNSGGTAAPTQYYTWQEEDLVILYNDVNFGGFVIDVEEKRCVKFVSEVSRSEWLVQEWRTGSRSGARGGRNGTETEQEQAVEERDAGSGTSRSREIEAGRAERGPLSLSGPQQPSSASSGGGSGSPAAVASGTGAAGRGPHDDATTHDRQLRGDRDLNYARWQEELLSPEALLASFGVSPHVIAAYRRQAAAARRQRRERKRRLVVSPNMRGNLWRLAQNVLASGKNIVLQGRPAHGSSDEDSDESVDSEMSRLAADFSSIHPRSRTSRRSTTSWNNEMNENDGSTASRRMDLSDAPSNSNRDVDEGPGTGPSSSRRSYGNNYRSTSAAESSRDDQTGTHGHDREPAQRTRLSFGGGHDIPGNAGANGHNDNSAPSTSFTFSDFDIEDLERRMTASSALRQLRLRSRGGTTAQTPHLRASRALVCQLAELHLRTRNVTAGENDDDEDGADAGFLEVDFGEEIYLRRNRCRALVCARAALCLISPLYIDFFLGGAKLEPSTTETGPDNAEAVAEGEAVANRRFYQALCTMGLVFAIPSVGYLLSDCVLACICECMWRAWCCCCCCCTSDSEVVEAQELISPSAASADNLAHNSSGDEEEDHSEETSSASDSHADASASNTDVAPAAGRSDAEGRRRGNNDNVDDRKPWMHRIPLRDGPTRTAERTRTRRPTSSEPTATVIGRSSSSGNAGGVTFQNDRSDSRPPHAQESSSGRLVDGSSSSSRGEQGEEVVQDVAADSTRPVARRRCKDILKSCRLGRFCCRTRHSHAREGQAGQQQDVVGTTAISSSSRENYTNSGSGSRRRGRGRAAENSLSATTSRTRSADVASHRQLQEQDADDSARPRATSRGETGAASSGAPGVRTKPIDSISARNIVEVLLLDEIFCVPAKTM